MVRRQWQSRNTLSRLSLLRGQREPANGCSVESAENFSWSGMSSAVRRLTQGALAPNPHTSLIKCTAGHHDQFACFASTHLRAGATDSDGGCLAGFYTCNNGLPQLGASGDYLKQTMANQLVEHSRYINTHGQDLPEIRNWIWNPAP